MRVWLEKKIAEVAPMPALDLMAVLMAQTGWSYPELKATPQPVLEDYLLIKEAEARLAREKQE